MKRILSYTLLLLLNLPLFAHAGLPRSSSVPGGVAVVPLGKVVADAKPPQVWLGDQPVLVTSERGKWYAVVGLALSMKPGKHTLRIMIGNLAKTRDFNIRSKRYPRQDIMMKDKSKVQLSPEDAERAGREIATILNLKLHWRDAPDTDPVLALPAEGQLGGRFGMRRYFNGEARAPHSGLDVAVPAGTPVRASSHGEVLAVDDYFFNGKTVFLDHGNGLITMYCHLDRIDLKPGDIVGKGQPIGLSGQTGRATGPHLHWSVVLNGAMVDPELFIPEQQARGAD
jgi:murein DD-endopeptidase MepM/ murein hydrolase activator NlpD